MQLRHLKTCHKFLLKIYIYDAICLGIIIYNALNIRNNERIEERGVTLGANIEDFFFANKYMDFEGFDNLKGDAESPIVPNIVHYVHLNESEVSSDLYWSILSVLTYQKPQCIFIHLSENKTLAGHYWTKLNKKYAHIFKVTHLNHKDTIFGVKSQHGLKHISDVLRLEVLMHYGGICVEKHVVLGGSLDEFLRFEMTIFSNGEDSIQNDVLIANGNARFLKTWHDSYRYTFQAK